MILDDLMDDLGQLTLDSQIAVFKTKAKDSRSTHPNAPEAHQLNHQTARPQQYIAVKHDEVEGGRGDNAIIQKGQASRFLQSSLDIELSSGPTDVRIFEIVEEVSEMECFSLPDIRFAERKLI